MENRFIMPDLSCQLNISIVLLFAIGSIFTAILIIPIPATYAVDASCKNISSLWSHTYDHSRFYEYNNPDYITVTGKVLTVTPPDQREGDGDFHFNLFVDSKYQYSNAANCKNPLASGKCQELIVEIVCYEHSAIKFQAAQEACKNYQNDIKGPKKR